MSGTVIRRRIGNNLYSVKYKCEKCGELLFERKEEIIPQRWINQIHTIEQTNEQNYHRIRRGFNVVGYVCDKCFEQYMKDNPRCTSDAKDDCFKKDKEK